MILLDTNICIGILRGDRNVLAAYARNAGNVAISAMTVGELFFGAEKSQSKERNRELVNRFVDAMPIIQTDNDIMRCFGVEKARLKNAGMTVEDADIIIAATALALSTPLATGNVKHFVRFPGLELEDWFLPFKQS